MHKQDEKSKKDFEKFETQNTRRKFTDFIRTENIKITLSLCILYYAEVNFDKQFIKSLLIEV